MKRIIFWQSSHAFGVSGENNMARGWLDLLSENHIVLDRVAPPSGEDHWFGGIRKHVSQSGPNAEVPITNYKPGAIHAARF